MMTVIMLMSTGTATRKMVMRLAFVISAMTDAITNMTGERTAMRTSIISVFCTLPTSVVRRVTSEAVENLSTLWKEKSWILWKIACRRHLAKPIEPTADSRAPSAPNPSDSNAISSIAPPTMRI